MRASAFVSVSAGILLVLLLLSSGCGQRPGTGSGGGGFQPFWESTPAPTGTPATPTPDVGSVVEITYATITITPKPTAAEVTYVEVLNKEYAFGNATVLEYDAKHAPLLVDVTLKPNIVSRGTVERDPTCTPTDYNTCLRAVTATYPDPNAWFTIKVINAGTGQVVAQDGYGRDYDVSQEIHLKGRTAGMYRIEMAGGRMSAVVRLRVATSDPVETTTSTPVPTTAAPSGGAVKIIGLSFPRQSGNDLLIPYEGNRRDDPQLSYLTVIIGDTMRLNTINANGELGTGPGVKPLPNVVLTKAGVLTPGYDHIEVIGYFSDGTEQRFFDTMV